MSSSSVTPVLATNHREATASLTVSAGVGAATTAAYDLVRGTADLAFVDVGRRGIGGSSFGATAPPLINETTTCRQ